LLLEIHKGINTELAQDLYYFHIEAL